MNSNSDTLRKEDYSVICQNSAVNAWRLGRLTLELTHISHARFTAKGAVCPSRAGMWRGRAVTP